MALPWCYPGTLGTHTKLDVGHSLDPKFPVNMHRSHVFYEVSLRSVLCHVSVASLSEIVAQKDQGDGLGLRTPEHMSTEFLPRDLLALSPVLIWTESG